jgi:hypothetical protein
LLFGGAADATYLLRYLASKYIAVTSSMKETTQRLSELSGELKTLIDKTQSGEIQHVEAVEHIVNLRAQMSKVIKDLKQKVRHSKRNAS